MTQLLSLPMYNVEPADTRLLVDTLRQLLAQEGIDDWHYAEPDDRLAHWQDPALLLSQTCGYPLCALLPDVQVVGTFHYDAQGCSGYCYSSRLVVREADAAKRLADFAGGRAVCNSEDSLSGFHTLRAEIAALRQDGGFFSSVLLSGGHRQSLQALQNNAADLAAIDAVSWALFSRHQPALLQGLTTIGYTAALPGLPLIAAAGTSAATLQKLRRTLTRLVSEPQWREVCSALLISAFTATDREDYQPVSQLIARLPPVAPASAAASPADRRSSSHPAL